ncbi:MAG: hypothetical protein K0M45_10945 [Candidatus Paracaedibacteraceae bacterium]|nr:hypothetical protein [Candidatus Paracaedibacteraceae bacterium]
MLAFLTRTLLLAFSMIVTSYTQEIFITSTNSLTVEFSSYPSQVSQLQLSNDSLSMKALNWKGPQKKLKVPQKNLVRKAQNDDKLAQLDLIDAFRHHKDGFTLTKYNQKIILQLLTEFAETNPLLRPTLIKAYRDGEFGLEPTHLETAEIGKNLALKYISSPGIGNMVIEAMRAGLLNFKSCDNYLEYLRKLAFKLKNQNAQVFLLECYIKSQYGAASFNKKLFREVVEKLEPYAEPNSLLAGLIIAVWQQNLLGFKNKKELKKEQLRINQYFNEKSLKKRQKENFFLLESFSAFNL